MHRDIKPANILLYEQVEPHLTDFGLAKVMRPGSSDPDAGSSPPRSCFDFLYAATDPVTDGTTNLAYTLGMSAATGTGTGVDQAYSVTGTMAAAQAGNCLTAACTNGAGVVRTVYVVY